jgi:hypothetical protein
MKRKSRKLTLSRESLHNLRSPGAAVGGIDNQDQSITCNGYGGCSEWAACGTYGSDPCTDGCNTYRCSFFC